MKVEMWPLDKIKPYYKNPRRNDKAVPKVMASIREFGVRQPIVVEEEGIILVGHTRLKAAKKLGLAEFPVHQALGLTKAQKNAYRLMDNRSGEEATWDMDLLSEELADLSIEGYDLDLTGFDAIEINALKGGGKEEARQKLAERFGIPPFSVFNAREGWWQDRKRAWIAIIGNSGAGRGGNLLKMSKTAEAAYKGKLPNKRAQRDPIE